jgi:DNA-binding MarR family transcriptional regulator
MGSRSGPWFLWGALFHSKNAHQPITCVRTHLNWRRCGCLVLDFAGTMSSKTPAKPKHTAAARITPEQHDTWFALLFIHASVTDRIDRDLQEQHRISFSATEILCRLHDEEPQSVRALADRLISVSPTRASRLVQELVDAGYLQRGADQGDGRKSLISFTPAGRSYSEEVARTFEDAILRYFIDPLDDEDLAAIARVWDKLRAAQAQELAPVSS